MPEFSGPSLELWQYLRQNAPQAEDVLSEMSITMDGEATGIQIAIDSTGLMHLLVPVTTQPPAELPPDLTGLRIRHRNLDRGEVMDIFSPPAYEAVFTPFCKRLLQALLVESREPWAAARTEIRSWAAAMRAPRNDFSRITQIGLFGELWVLSNVLIPQIGGDAIDHWTGPDRERHDFVGERAHLEVKTTTRSEPQFHISRIDQLYEPNEKSLFLAAVQIEESKGGQQNIGEMIDRIRHQLTGDAGALDQFLGKVSACGWYEELRHSGELLRFSLRDVEFYRVNEIFPKISSDFIVPNGVRNIEYDINLCNLPGLDKSEVSKFITLF